MTTQYWLVKSEPETYSWADLVRDKRTDWTGVRNYAARLHLRAMRPGDAVFFYHSGEAKSIVGIARVTKPAFPDPTADEEGLPASGGAKGGQGWVAVELAPVAPLKRPVTLEQVKAKVALKDIALIRQGRLSVQPLKPTEFALIRKLGGG
jgi:predicted RNA-binding protein with PUA-like domain